MKEDYFDPDLETENMLLPETEPRKNPPPVAVEKPTKRQFMGHDLSTLLVAGGAAIMLVIFAVWPENTPAPATILEEVSPVDHAKPFETAEIFLVDPETEALREFSGANREAISLLHERTGVVEQRLTDMGQQLSTLASSAVTHSQASDNVSPARPSSLNARNLPGWRIRTLHPGVAWLTWNGSTWAVHTGETLHGITILEINLEQRVVVTDKGVIRQGS
jgi:intracellular multiplication protein IcmG